MKFVKFILAALVAVAFAVISIPAFSAQQYKSERMTVRLLDDGCSVLELAFALAMQGAAKRATVTIEDVTYEACWVAVEDKIILVDIFGSAGYILASDFKPE